jgi:hypothetical protein
MSQNTNQCFSSAVSKLFSRISSTDSGTFPLKRLSIKAPRPSVSILFSFRGASYFDRTESAQCWDKKGRRSYRRPPLDLYRNKNRLRWYSFRYDVGQFSFSRIPRSEFGGYANQKAHDARLKQIALREVYTREQSSRNVEVNERSAQQSYPTEIVGNSSDQLQSRDVIHVGTPLERHNTPFLATVKVESVCNCRSLLLWSA